MQNIFPSSFRTKVFGQSMYPFLLDGDIVTLQKKEFNSLAVGDIICVSKNKKMFVHRVIYRTHKYLITKGDNNRIADGKVSKNNIIGIVKKIKRGYQTFKPDDFYLFQSTLYFKEIINVKNYLENRTINFLFLKGLPLYLHIESSHPKRLYFDCDILIDKNYYFSAKTILEKLGYKEMDTSFSRVQKRLKNKNSEISFYKIINGFFVVFDIHLEVVFMMTQLGELNQLYPQKFIDSLTKDFLGDKICVNINNNCFPILSSENLILYLGLHIFHHNFKGGFRYEILSRFVQFANPDYRLLAKKISYYKLAPFIYPSLILLQKYYKTKLPQHFLKTIEPSKKQLKFISNDILKGNIFNEEQRMKEGIVRFRNLFFLSSTPLYKRLFVFLNLSVIYSVFFMIYRKLRL